MRANKLMDSSCPGSDSSESDEGGRKRKIPKRFVDSSPDEIPFKNVNKSFEVESKKAFSIKKYIVPDFPSAKLKNSLISSQNESLREESADAHSQSLLSPMRSTFSKVRNTSGNELNISDNNHDCCRNNTKVISFCSRIFDSLGKIEREVKAINRKQENNSILINNILKKMDLTDGNDMPGSSSKFLYTLPDEIELPAKSDFDLLNLNKKLGEDKDSLPLILIRYLQQSVSGRTEAAFLLNVTRKIMTREVALLYSRLGRKGKKRFEDLSALYNVILATGSSKFPDSRREDLAERFGKVLSTAADWDGKSVERKRKISVEENSLYFTETLARLNQ